jgi:hypothetical protein
MKSKAGRISRLFGCFLAVMMLSAIGSEASLAGPSKRGSSGPTSQPPPPPPPPAKEVKQEEPSEYVYRDTRMIRVPILPPFPIF